MSFVNIVWWSTQSKAICPVTSCITVIVCVCSAFGEEHQTLLWHNSLDDRVIVILVTKWCGSRDDDQLADFGCIRNQIGYKKKCICSTYACNRIDDDDYMLLRPTTTPTTTSKPRTTTSIWSRYRFSGSRRTTKAPPPKFYRIGKALGDILKGQSVLM